MTWEANEAWERDSVHATRPLLPLTVSVWADLMEVGTKKGFAEWSLPIESYRLKAFNGWMYTRVEPLGGEPPALVKKLPVLAHLWRIDPNVRKRILGFDRFVQEGGFERQVPRGGAEGGPEAGG